MKAGVLSAASILTLVILAAPGLADSRSEKYRSSGCEIERKFDDDGKFESKIECKPGRGQARLGDDAKEEFRQGGCKVKREWKKDGAYKEEVTCD